MGRDEFLVQGSIGMARGSVLRVEDGRDLVIYVWEGDVWLTQEGEARDRHLGAGQWFRLDRNGVALASALRRTVMTLTAPEPRLYARRIALARAGDAVPVELYRAEKDDVAPLAWLRRRWARPILQG